MTWIIATVLVVIAALLGTIAHTLDQIGTSDTTGAVASSLLIGSRSD